MERLYCFSKPQKYEAHVSTQLTIEFSFKMFFYSLAKQ